MLEETKDAALKAVERKFEQWRTQREKRGPTPPELLAAIPVLSKRHSLYQLTKALRMNYRTVEKAAVGRSPRAEGSRGTGSGTKRASAAFVEIPLGRSMAAVEMETPWGYKARITAGDDPAGRIEGWLKLLLMARR
jgi:hypothetical protein